MAPSTSGRRPRRSRPSGESPPATPGSGATLAEPGFALRPRRSETRPTNAPTARKERGAFYRMTHPQFIGNVVGELRRVVWPSRQETQSLTIVVIVVAVAVGAVLGVVDWAFNRILENVLLP